MLRWSIIFDSLPFLLAGAWTTPELTVVSIIFAIVAGLPVELSEILWGKDRERYYARHAPNGAEGGVLE
jgi:ABC-type amino acid transport system permease subunit